MLSGYKAWVGFRVRIRAIIRLGYRIREVLIAVPDFILGLCRCVTGSSNQ